MRSWQRHLEWLRNAICLGAHKQQTNTNSNNMEMICFIFKCGVSYNVSLRPRVLFLLLLFSLQFSQTVTKVAGTGDSLSFIEGDNFFFLAHPQRGDAYFYIYTYIRELCELFFLPEHFVIVVQCLGQDCTVESESI